MKYKECDSLDSLSPEALQPSSPAMDLGGGAHNRCRPGSFFLFKRVLLVILLLARPSSIWSRQIAGDSATVTPARLHSPTTSPAFSSVMAQGRSQLANTVGRFSLSSSQLSYSDMAPVNFDSPIVSVELTCCISRNSETSPAPRSDANVLWSFALKFRSGPCTQCLLPSVSTFDVQTQDLHSYSMSSSAPRFQLRQPSPRRSICTFFPPPVVCRFHSNRPSIRTGEESHRYCFSLTRDRYDFVSPSFEVFTIILVPRMGRSNLQGTDGDPGSSVYFAMFPGQLNRQFFPIFDRLASRLSAAIFTGCDVFRLAGLFCSISPVATASHRQMRRRLISIRTSQAAKADVAETLILLMGHRSSRLKLPSHTGHVFGPYFVMVMGCIPQLIFPCCTRWAIWAFVRENNVSGF